MFDTRSMNSELLDHPNFAADLVERSYMFMAGVNRCFGGVRAVRRFVAAEAAANHGRPLHVLDIGSGACDIPLAVSGWARHRGLDVRFTCVDCHPQANRLAQSNLARTRDSAVLLVQEDIFQHRPREPYDCAVGSMFFHHLSDQNILLLISRLRGYVRGSLLINDLRRSVGNYLSCLLASPHLPWQVRHDALLSIRRGFKVRQLRQLLGGVESATADVKGCYFFRVQAVVRF